MPISCIHRMKAGHAMFFSLFPYQTYLICFRALNCCGDLSYSNDELLENKTQDSAAILDTSLIFTLIVQVEL